MTYPRANIRFTYVQPADDDADGRAALAELMASDGQWAIGEGLTNVETVRIIQRDFSRPQVSPPDNPPWWHALRAGDSVKAQRDGVMIWLVDGRQAMASGAPMVRNKGRVLQLFRAPDDVDRAQGRLMVFTDAATIPGVGANPWPGGLFVAAADVEAA